jgi:hypothetical protein
MQPSQVDGAHGVRIKIFTWNMGNSHYTQNEWLEEVKKSWSIITIKDFDVLGICLQEDSRGKFGKLVDAIGQYLSSEFTFVCDSVEGPPEITKQSYTVRACLYLRKTMFVNYTTRKQDVCLSRTVYCTKSSAGISVIYTLEGNVYQLILISSHLPVDTSSADYGYEGRIQATKTTFEKVYDVLADTTIEKRLAFWGGDLNFRDNSPVTPRGKPFSDQLKYAFSTRPASFFREFEEPEVQFPPTCKMIECDKQTCPSCRIRSNEITIPACYAKDGEKPKANVELQPSHCDRILYRADGIDGEILEYKSWGRATSIQHSDHNAVYCTFLVHL